MQTAIIDSTVASVTGANSFRSPINTKPCLLPFSVLQDSMAYAKQQHSRHGRGSAYSRLLNQFHKAILPVFVAETKGNLSEMSRLLGIHRETVKNYAHLADVDIFNSTEG